MGNLRRHRAVTAKAGRIGDRPRRSALGAATSPMEYVDLLRKGYEQKRKREADDQAGNAREEKPAERKKEVKTERANPYKDEREK